MIFDIFRRKRPEIELPMPPPALPAELERFRITPPPIPHQPPTPYQPPLEPKPTPPADRLELILAKLETIDARLKVIEEKIERSRSAPLY